MSPFSDSPDGAILTVRVTPRAGRTVVAGIADAQLLVRIAAAPVDNAANDALVALLADLLGLPKRSIEVAGGHRSRTKRIRIRGGRAADLERRLAAALK